MRKTAFIFPGQGAQAIGMGKEFFDNYDVAKKLFNAADDALGFSIKEMCFNGSEADLQLTANTQPAILVVSVIASEILKSEGIEPSIAGGHSLGEYSALVSAGAIAFEDAVVLVHKRGQFMQEAVPVGEGAMAAIIGLDDEKIIEVCNRLTQSVGTVEAVNFNCPGQTVIAGTESTRRKAIGNSAGKRAFPQSIDGVRRRKTRRRTRQGLDQRCEISDCGKCRRQARAGFGNNQTQFDQPDGASRQVDRMRQNDARFRRRYIHRSRSGQNALRFQSPDRSKFEQLQRRKHRVAQSDSRAIEKIMSLGVKNCRQRKIFVLYFQASI